MRVMLAGALLIALGACGSEPELTEAEAQSLGRAAVDRAIELFQAGRIRESWQEFKRAEAIASDFASQVSGGEEDRAPAAGIGLPGGPAGQWVSEWRKEYKSAIELSWSVVRDAVREETIDLSLLKGFVSEQLGRDQLDRLTQEYRFAEPTLMQRRAGQYWFTCDGQAEVCGIVYEVLRERMGPRTVTANWTGNRQDYLGVIETRVSVLESLTYRAAGASSVGGFPKRVSVQLEPKLHSGVGPWSRPFSTTLDGNPPSQIDRGEYGGVHRRHFEGFAVQLRESLASWPDAADASPGL